MQEYLTKFGDILKLTKKQNKELVKANSLLKVNFDITPKVKQLKNIVKQKVVFNAKPVKVIAAKNKSFKLPNYKNK